MPATSSADVPQFEIGSERGPANTVVVRVAGEVDMSREGEVRAELASLDGLERNGIVVDLTECEFIDSSGVRALLLSQETQSGGSGGGLAVAASNDQILRILSVMGLDKVLPIRPTVDEAAAALSD
jgi:anti-sigma B factor antagonist